ncbi:MAG: ATP-binding protein [Pseudomonadota bacterium]
MNKYILPPFLNLLFFLSFGFFVFIKGRRQKANRLFILVCAQGALLNIDIILMSVLPKYETALWISRFDHFLFVYVVPLYLHFFYAYLHVQARPWILKIAYLYSLLFMFVVPTPLYIPYLHSYFFGYFAHSGPLFWAFEAGAVSVIICSLYLIFQSIRMESNRVRKSKLKYVFFGFGLMGALNCLNIFPMMGYEMYPPGNFSFIPLMIFAFGLFRHDLFDMGVIVKKSLIYSLIGVLLIAIYALIVTAANRIFIGHCLTELNWFWLFFFLFVAFILGPLKAAVQLLVDRFFLKTKYDYQQTIRGVGKSIATCLSRGEIIDRVIDAVSSSMSAKSVRVFLKEPEGFRLKSHISGDENAMYKGAQGCELREENRLLQAIIKTPMPISAWQVGDKWPGEEGVEILSEMDRIQAELVIPIVFQNFIKGLLVLGEKKSEDPYSIEDIDLLTTLADQCALAIENADAYSTIRELNSGLEQRIAKRTEELERALKEKDEAQEQLIRGESLSAVGQLVAGVAHELNNPMGSVTSLIQSIIEDADREGIAAIASQEALDDLKFSLKELQRANSIVASLLGVSRQSQTYTEPVNMNVIVEDALRVLHNQYRHLGVDIKLNLEQALPEIRGNYANMGQVAINIIQNAIQAIPKNGGLIIISTLFDSSAGCVIFQCEDNGPGITREIQQDIFKPFFTTKGVGKGTGLGLYISYEIVRRHNGSIQVMGRDGGGAIFIVRIPAKQE